MSYTLAGIRSRVLVDKLDDEDFDSQVVDNFINDAQRDIFQEYTLPFTEKIFTGDLPSGATIVEFPSDVSVLQSLTIADALGRGYDVKDRFLDFRTFNEHYRSPATATVGSVHNWSLYGNKMLLSRPTDQDYFMTIYYNKTPAELTTGTQVPELPEEFEEALVLGAFYRVQFREGDSDEALVTRSEYQRKLEQMVSRYGFRMNAGPIRMKNRQVGR